MGTGSCARRCLGMPSAEVKAGEHCLFRVCTELVYRKSPKFDDTLTKDLKTIVKEDTFIKGYIKRGEDGVVYTEVVVDAGDRMVLCYLPMFNKDDRADVYIRYL